jgi:hypothetical protein
MKPHKLIGSAADLNTVPVLRYSDLVMLESATEFVPQKISLLSKIIDTYGWAD